MRKPLIAGNWKMNLDQAAARALVHDLRGRLRPAAAVEVAVCPPAVYLLAVAKAVEAGPIKLGAQNCSAEASGAFTGEVSVAMLKDVGAHFVILGHSERRHAIGPPRGQGGVWGETDDMIAAKARAVLAGGLTPIVCIGETLTERDAGQTEAVLTRQIAGSLSGLAPADAARIVVAYEPVWAIGTGRNATPEQAEAAHRHIRTKLAEQFGQSVAEQIRLQYGGSVKPDNTESLMKCPDVDGALVGGASLKAADFAAIIDGCLRAKRL